MAASKLVIHAPKRLMDIFPYTNQDGRKELGVIPASYANFGFVPYGHSMVSIILMPYSASIELVLNLVIHSYRWERSISIRAILSSVTKLNHRSSILDKLTSKRRMRMEKMLHSLLHSW